MIRLRLVPWALLAGIAGCAKPAAPAIPVEG